MKDGKVIAKIDANGQILTYLYSTGEILTISSKKSPTSISESGSPIKMVFLYMSLMEENGNSLIEKENKL